MRPHSRHKLLKHTHPHGNTSHLIALIYIPLSSKHHIHQDAGTSTPLHHQRINGSHMSDTYPEVCNGKSCLKCVALRGRQVCAEREEIPGTSYLDFQDLTPEYKKDIKRRFMTTSSTSATRSPTTPSTPPSPSPQVFSVEGFQGFSNHATLPPREVLEWSIADNNVTQEYVVDQTTGQVFEKAPIYTDQANLTPSLSPNEISSALDAQDHLSQKVQERASPPTTLLEESPDTTELPDSTPSEEVVTPTKPTLNNKSGEPKIAGGVNEGGEEVERTDEVGTLSSTSSEESTVLSTSPTDPTTSPTTATTTTTTNAPNSTERGTFAEISETSPIDFRTTNFEDTELNTSPTPPHQSTASPTSPGSSNHSNWPTSWSSEPHPTSEGSGLSEADSDLASSIQDRNDSTIRTSYSLTTPSAPSAPPHSSSGRNSGGFLSGLIGAAGSVVSGVLSVKDSIVNTATSSVSAGISGIIQGASGLGTLANTKRGKPGKKKVKPRTTPKPKQADSNPGQSRTVSTPSSTTKRTPRPSTKLASQRPLLTQRKTPTTKRPSVLGSKLSNQTAKINPTRATAKPVTSSTKTPAWPRQTPTPTRGDHSPQASGNSRSNWFSKGIDQLGGLDQLTSSFSSLAEQKIKNTLLPVDTPPALDHHTDYPAYLNYGEVEGSGLSHDLGDIPWDSTEKLFGKEASSNEPEQTPPPGTIPTGLRAPATFPPTRMPPGKLGGRGNGNPGNRGGSSQNPKRCGQRLGCSEWGQFKQDTLVPFIQLLSDGEGQGLDMFPDDKSGSQLFSKEGLNSFSDNLEAISSGAPLELNTGIKMLLKFSLATLAQTRMARINSQDQSELSRWTDLGLTLPGLFLGLFYFLYLVRQLHSQWKANAVQKERRRELDRDARMLKNLQATRRRPAHDRALEMPLRNRRDYDVEAQPNYE